MEAHASPPSAAVAAHEPVSWRAILRRQLEWIGRRRWRELAMLGGLLAVLQIGVAVQFFRFVPPGIDAVETMNSVILQMVLSVSLVIVAVWPLSVWSEESPSRRGYHYSLPAERSGHDLSRVVAGAFWIVVTLMGAAVIGGSGFWVATGYPPPLEFGFVAWIHHAGGMVVLYLLVSSICTAVERPLWWLFGGWLAIAITAAIVGRVAPWLVRFLEALITGPWGVFTAATGSVERLSGVSDASLPTGPVVLWLAVSIVLLLLTVSRHREATY